MTEEIKNYTCSISNARPIVILDGMNNFIRHYVVNQSTNANGDLYGGAIGFLNTIKQMVRIFRPTQIIVVWEQGGPSPRRKQIFSEYKANRTKVKELDGAYRNDRDMLLSDTETKARQVKFLVKVLSKLPILQIYIPECEGDDVVAYLAKRKFYTHKGIKVVVSGDHDFYQLLDDPTIRIYNPLKKVLINGDDILNEYGIAPRNFCIARAIVGDVSDNIGGIDGVGLKTVAKRFPQLKDTEKDYLIVNIAEIAQESMQVKKAPKCYSDILTKLEIVLRNYNLMYLDTHNFSASQLEKINTKVDNFVPTLNHLEFLKTFGAFEIPITEEMVRLSQDLRYLTAKSS